MTILGIILIGLVCGMLDSFSLDIVIWYFWVFFFRFFSLWFLLNFTPKHVFGVEFLFTNYNFIWYFRFRILEGFNCWFRSGHEVLIQVCKYRAMSFVFRGARADLENGFPGFIPERRALVCSVCIHYYLHICVI
jgi:hypothetical protein